MTRIDQIIEHEAAAEKPSREASVHMWTAARLIWEEVQAGKSEQKLGKEIGKSHVHVHYMKRSWEEICANRAVNADPETLPPFGEIYYSPEVRGPAYETNTGHRKVAGIPRSGGYSDSDYEDAESEDTPHAWVLSAESAIDRLFTHRAAWRSLSEDDREILDSLVGKIGKIIRRPERRKRSA